MVTRNRNFLLFGSFGLILIGIILASIIDRVTTAKNGPTDISARAGVTKNLTVNATVVSGDPIKTTMIVTDVYFTDESRSGDAKNLGAWLVNVPADFNFTTVAPGETVIIGVKAASVKVSDHTLSATTITVQK